jgi:polyisoprenoid-binding protein YceI
MKSIILIAACFLAAASVGPAADMTIELDPQSSSINFVVKATLHSVHGKADAASGSLILDTESGVMSGEVVVDAVSADTGNKKRDKKMHAKVLRSAQHSRIVLRPRRLDGNLATEGASEVTLHGNMVVLGQPHDVHIPLQIEIINGRFTAVAVFDLPYVDWGLEDPSTFVLRVAKVVEVKVAAEGSITGP